MDFVQIAFQPPSSNRTLWGYFFRRKLVNFLKQRFWLCEWIFWQWQWSNIILRCRAAQLVELSMTAGYPWKLSMSAYLQNFATKNAVFTNFRNKNAVFTHFRDKNAVFTHFCVKNLWFHRYVTICLTRASTYTFRSCFVIILSPQVRAYCIDRKSVLSIKNLVYR